MNELEERLNQLTAELIREYRHYRRDTGKIAALMAEISGLEALLPRSEPSPEELKRAELERALREARGRELAALRALESQFGDWEEYESRREAYEAARQEREAFEEYLERR